MVLFLVLITSCLVHISHAFNENINTYNSINMGYNNIKNDNKNENYNNFDMMPQNQAPYTDKKVCALVMLCGFVSVVINLLSTEVYLSTSYKYLLNAIISFTPLSLSTSLICLLTFSFFFYLLYTFIYLPSLSCLPILSTTYLRCRRSCVTTLVSRVVKCGAWTV